MKTLDAILVVVVLLLLIVIAKCYSIGFLFKLLIAVILVAYFVYTKLKPYASKLDPKYKSKFDQVQGIFDGVTNLFNSIPKWQVGPGLIMDPSQIIVMSILALILCIL